jgi:hypothetical protein
MKTTIKTAFVALLFVSALAAAILASPNKLFNVVNNSSFAVGSVTIFNDDGTPTTIDVPGPGTFSASIRDGVSKAVINGQTITRNGQVTNITLASGIVVQATLTGGQIVVTDQTTIYTGPKGKK